MTEHERKDVGEIVRIDNGDGFQTKPDLDLFDPSDVQLWIKEPDGTVTDLSSTVNRDEEGLYHADFTTTQWGWHYYHWDGDAVIEEDEFYVRRPNVEIP